MLSRNKNIIAGIFLSAFSLLYFRLSFSIPLTSIDRQVGSRLVPQICGMLLLFFSVWLAAGGIIAKKVLGVKNVQADAQSDEDGKTGMEGKGKPCYLSTVLVFAGFALYIYLMEMVGFVISTLIYLFTQMILLEAKGKKKKYLLYAVVSICATLATYMLFVRVFYLILPKGKLF